MNSDNYWSSFTSFDGTETSPDNVSDADAKIGTNEEHAEYVPGSIMGSGGIDWSELENANKKKKNNSDDSSDFPDGSTVYQKKKRPLDEDDEDEEGDDDNASFDKFDKKIMEYRLDKGLLFKEFISKLSRTKSKDARTVLKHIQRGNKIAVANVSNKLSKNISDFLFSSDTSFLMRKGKGKSYFCVRDVNRDALKRALERTTYEMQRGTTVYNYHSFTELVKNDKSIKSKELVHLSGLSEEQAEIIRREIAAHSRGMKFSMNRMNDNTWMMAFKKDDMINQEKRGSKYKNVDVLTALAFASIATTGPNAKMNQRRVALELKNERKAVDKFSKILRRAGNNVYVFDSYFPNRYIHMNKTQMDIYNVRNPFSEDAVSELEASFDMNDPFCDAVYQQNIMSFSSVSYVQDAASMNQIIKNPRTASERKQMFEQIQKSDKREQVLSEKLVDGFYQKYSEYDVLHDPSQQDNIVPTFGTYMAQTMNQIANVPIDKIQDATVKSIAMYMAANQMQAQNYIQAAETVRNADIKIDVPHEKRMSVKKELERIQNEMKYDPYALNQEIEESREENRKRREGEDID